MVDRASRPHAAINSDLARDKSIVLPPNSQQFPSENSPSSPSQLNDALGPESPAEQIRNALQILRGDGVARELLKVTGLGYAYPTDDVDAIDRLLTAALEQLEAPGYDWQYRAGLDVFELAPVDTGRCIHCGCNDLEACTVDVAQLPADDRRAVTEYCAETGTPLCDRMPCWWISREPRVCSAPHCAELHRAATVGVMP